MKSDMLSSMLKLNNIRFKNYVAILWVFVVIGALYYYIHNGISVTDIQRRLVSFGGWSAVFFVVAYIVRPLIFFPASIMTSLSAVLFGPVFGWIYAYIGENIAASVAFYVARYFRELFSKWKRGVFAHYDKQLNTNGFMAVLTMRLIPFFPFDAVNYTSGLSSVTYRDYSFATLIGVIPGLTAYIFLGGSLNDPRFIIPTILLFVIMSFVTWLHRK
jgi:uncharacterized membrane protein YdjX (TVP38/TMEM64 family)